MIDTREPLAITVGLWQPYVAISSGLVAGLSARELRAVLAHEHAHVRRRDPLRLLLGRVLAAHLWFLPLATDMRSRARRGYELAADLQAAKHCGRAAVAGALLRVAAQPTTSPAFAARSPSRNCWRPGCHSWSPGLPSRPRSPGAAPR